jgi:hypothetical protein
MAVQTPLTAAVLLRSVGLLADGPAVWGRPFAAAGPCVFVVELSAPLASAPIELTRIGKWIERLSALRLDGEAPTSKELAARLASFWIPSTTVLYVGNANIAGQVGAIGRRFSATASRTPAALAPGPHRIERTASGGLDRRGRGYEGALFGAFAEGDPRTTTPAARHASPAVRESSLDRRRAQGPGLSGFLVPEDPAALGRDPGLDLPPGDAGGASGRRRRGPRVGRRGVRLGRHRHPVLRALLLRARLLRGRQLVPGRPLRVRLRVARLPALPMTPRTCRRRGSPVSARSWSP